MEDVRNVCTQRCLYLCPFDRFTHLRLRQDVDGQSIRCYRGFVIGARENEIIELNCDAVAVMCGLRDIPW